MPTYPLETHPLEIERLRVQSAAMAPDTQVMLERIGVQPGWNCLDLGCGPTGIADLLSPMSSRVTGLDKNESFLEYARRRAPANVEYLPADAYRTEQPDGSFDLVHMRFLASTAGDPERLLSEAMRVTRAGGVVARLESTAFAPASLRTGVRNSANAPRNRAMTQGVTVPPGRAACARLVMGPVYFGAFPLTIDRAARTNVCVGCGCSRPSRWLVAAGIVRNRRLVVPAFRCPDCGAWNLFTDDRP